MSGRPPLAGEGGQTIQWFPGHMMKTLRLMEAEVPHVDAVLILLDARIPFSSLNPEIEARCAAKPKLYILNKADLADAQATRSWTAYFRASGAGCVAISSRQRAQVAQVRPAVERELESLLARRAQKGQQGARIRLMLAGIPNVGKSTFINTFVGHAVAKTEDRPGVTRGKQWIACGRYDLLDMPGVLWKRFADRRTAVNLAFIGAIRDDILDMEELACGLLEEMRALYPQPLCARYRLQPEQLALPAGELLAQIGRRRGMLLAGGEVDTARAAIMLCDEFRASRFGPISLERP